MILPSRLTLGLGAALAISLAGNAFLFWQWAQAKPECVAKTAKTALKATQNAHDAATTRDRAASGVTKATDAAAAQVAENADKAAHTDNKDIHNAYFNRDSVVPVGPCPAVAPVPAGVQDVIERAVSRANRPAAAR